MEINTARSMNLLNKLPTASKYALNELYILKVMYDIRRIEKSCGCEIETIRKIHPEYVELERKLDELYQIRLDLAKRLK